MFATNTHLAAEGAPAVAQRYVLLYEALVVSVFRYMSPTTAEETPESLNIVAVVLVPVMPDPEYHLLAAPVAPLIDTLFPANTVVDDTDVMVYL